jgi:hypothetical protein
MAPACKSGKRTFGLLGSSCDGNHPGHDAPVRLRAQHPNDSASGLRDKSNRTVSELTGH